MGLDTQTDRYRRTRGPLPLPRAFRSASPRPPASDVYARGIPWFVKMSTNITNFHKASDSWQVRSRLGGIYKERVTVLSCFINCGILGGFVKDKEKKKGKKYGVPLYCSCMVVNIFFFFTFYSVFIRPAIDDLYTGIKLVDDGARSLFLMVW